MYVRNDNTCPFCGMIGTGLILRDKWKPLAFVVLSKDTGEHFLQGNFSFYVECMNCNAKGSVIWPERVVRAFLIDFSRKSQWFQPTKSCKGWGFKRKISWSLITDKLVSAFTDEGRCWSLESYQRLFHPSGSLADFCEEIRSVLHLMSNETFQFYWKASMMSLKEGFMLEIPVEEKAILNDWPLVPFRWLSLDSNKADLQRGKLDGQE